MSVNFHGVSEQDKRGPMGCVRFWYLLQGDCSMYIKLSQAYLSSSTQLFYDPETMYELWGNETVTGKWNHVEVSLYVTRPFKLIFLSGFNQTCTYGNIGLDDIEIFYTPCETTSTTQQQLHTTFSFNSSSTSTTKTSEEEATGLCVTDTPVPTTTNIPSHWIISQTVPHTATLKPPLHDFTIFPQDFMKPLTTTE
ncbi:hypothetical protein L798_07478 [Zootermopsis nevadensis]|uniref:MAM domain-containing protein n=2 Tax=Zootermopsis nevadensis TaxID=136037 RepID=A0A067REH2_ZOONE|nr:hypothetical protein L798_07478 [Zootermopsis nevadensis]